MSKRKERAKLSREWDEKMAEMSPEELAAMEESIPEWKRNALVVGDNDEEDEVKPGMFKRMKTAAGDKISNTEAAQKFYESEEYKKIKEVRAEVNSFKADLRD